MEMSNVILRLRKFVKKFNLFLRNFHFLFMQILDWKRVEIVTENPSILIRERFLLNFTFADNNEAHKNLTDIEREKKKE